MESTLYSVTSKRNLAILSRKWNVLVHCTLLYGGIISCLRGIKCLFFPWYIYFKNFIMTLSLTVFCHPSSLCYFSHRRDTHLPRNLCTAWNILSIVTCGTASHLLQDFAQMSSFPWALILSHLRFHPPSPHCSPKHWANSHMWYYITYIFIMFIFLAFFLLVQVPQGPSVFVLFTDVNIFLLNEWLCERMYLWSSHVWDGVKCGVGYLCVFI